MEINEAQAQTLEMRGFKWASQDCTGETSTDKVESSLIKRVIPIQEGFVVVYNDESVFVCSVCWVEKIEWQLSGKWIFVYYYQLEDTVRKSTANKMKNNH